MSQGLALLISVLMVALFLYGLYIAIRAGVAAGIRRALPDALLRTPTTDPFDATVRGPDGEQR